MATAHALTADYNDITGSLFDLAQHYRHLSEGKLAFSRFTPPYHDGHRHALFRPARWARHRDEFSDWAMNGSAKDSANNMTFPSAANTPSALQRLGSEGKGDFGSLVTWLGQTTILTAVLYYCGWVRAQSTFEYFGLDAASFGLDTADYVLRSPSAALRPAILGITLVLLVRLTIPVLADAMRRVPLVYSRTAMIVTGATGVSMLLVSLLPFVGLSPYLSLVPMTPYLLVGGLTLTCIAGWIGQEALGLGTHYGNRIKIPGLLLLSVSALWACASYAQIAGTDLAKNIAQTLPQRNSVSVYSKSRLSIAGPGVVTHTLDQPGEYFVRYDGLRLLIRSKNDELYLVPMYWKKGEDPVFVVKVTADIRVDFVAVRD